MTARVTVVSSSGALRRRALPLIAAALSVLAGCSAGLVNFAGLGITRRSEASTWTRASRQTAHDLPAQVSVLPAAAAGDVGVGHFTLLTYNVAGLPQALSPSTPRINIPQVSPLLNGYDVALVQEDFSYHDELIQQAYHRYRSTPMRARSFVGDGLSQFSSIEFAAVHRVRWDRCNGIVSSSTDCLADKGFSFSELRLASGIALHLYNLHADAGLGRRDVETRTHNFEQLADYMRRRSRGQAVIVAGDTNLRTNEPGDAETLDHFLELMGLGDACRALACPAEEPIDRVLYRGSSELMLESHRWWEDQRFVDEHGAPLSDHPAIAVEMRWRRKNQPPLVAQLGEP
jgi:endonuclease/exonuclease/phosphatase family metal-dependent hydrolase